MSNLSRKPPAKLDQSIEQFSFDIEDYLNKSPITSKFRQENPNLQPTTSNDTDIISSYGSLDPAVVTPPSPPPSGGSTPELKDQLQIKGHKPNPSVASINSTAFMTSPLEQTTTTDSRVSTSSRIKRSASKLDRLKRFSMTRFDDSKRFSSKRNDSTNGMNSSMKRLSLSSSFRNFASISRDSLPSLRTQESFQSLPNTVLDCNDSKISTPYWKYHVLRFGKDLYVTTNPSLKHMYCRNAPGYYIEVIENGSDSYTLMFRDAENQQDKSKPPIMTITKKPQREGGYFTTLLTRSSTMKKDLIKQMPKANGDKFNGLSLPQTIPEKYIPYDKISNTRFLENCEINFRNFEFRDFGNRRWNVGSIPRVRSSRINKLKTKINDLEAEKWKFIGKKNVYFHQNYIESENPLPFKLENPQDIYLQNPDNNNFPPVLAMFRPYKKKFSTTMKNFNKRLSRKIDHDSSQLKSEKFNNHLVDNDMSGGGIKNYYIAGDGLYYNNAPQDDVPDENKLGWVTIYEDKLFQERGFFDLVLGMTLAVGYEASRA